MSEQIKRMSVKEFREKGYLAALNLFFLHPLGLAMEVMIDEDTKKESFGEVWDYRDDPEGLLFDKTNMKQTAKKINKIRADWNKKAKHRLNKYGFVLQDREI